MMKKDEEEIYKLEKKLKLKNEKSKMSFKKHMIRDNWEEMFDFLDNMNTEKVYDSMILRNESQMQKK